MKKVNRVYVATEVPDGYASHIFLGAARSHKKIEKFLKDLYPRIYEVARFKNGTVRYRVKEACSPLIIVRVVELGREVKI